jgi:hypothetical protein
MPRSLHGTVLRGKQGARNDMKTTRSITRTQRLQEYNLEPREVRKRRVGVIELTDEEYEDFVASKKKYEDWQERLDKALDAEGD